MTLLEEIIDGATGGMPVTDLLRKLKVLSSRIGTVKLDQWVAHERDGYPSSENLPGYRGPFDQMVMGHFFGPYKSEATVAIPRSSMPQDQPAIDSLFEIRLTQPISQIEDYAKRDSVTFGWGPDTVKIYNSHVRIGTIRPLLAIPNMQLMQAKQHVDMAMFTCALDGVRNRVLDVALDIEKVAPEAGQKDASPEIKSQAVQAVNNFHILAPSNVAVNSSHVTQSVRVLPGDVSSLLAALKAEGVDGKNLSNLAEAIEGDRIEAGGSHPPAPGNRVKAWLGSAVVDFTSGAAAGLVVEAVKAFFAG